MNAKGLLQAAVQSVHGVAGGLVRQEAEQQENAAAPDTYTPETAARNVDAYLLARQLDQANAQVNWLHQSAVSGLHSGDQAKAFPAQLALAVSQRDALAQKLNSVRQAQQQAGLQAEAQRQRADAQRRDQILNTAPAGQTPQAPAPWLSDAE